MKAPGDIEIVIKARADGNFTVESSSREIYRNMQVLRVALQSMVNEANRLRGKLLLPNNHVGHFERSA